MNDQLTDRNNANGVIEKKLFTALAGMGVRMLSPRGSRKVDKINVLNLPSSLCNYIALLTGCSKRHL